LNLAEPGALKAFLGRHGLTASKGLGQHFLCSRTVVKAIEERFSRFQGLLEIGPGPGVLTAPLSETVEKIIALEVDDRMIAALQDSAPRADVRKSDALKADLAAILEELPEPRGVVSNLPYYITGPLLTRIAEARGHYAKAVLMMQKEVAERVLAAPKTSARGSLSVFLQLQFEIEKVASAPAGAFLPPPKVDSTVLQFVPKETGLTDEEEKALFRLVRVGFTQPRKTLANNMTGLGIKREEALERIQSIGLLETARPQELTLDEWKEVARAARP
jgi:16S rRNA (adenine1518-N6/adenine1519-N6)-dimethyltransferase